MSAAVPTSNAERASVKSVGEGRSFFTVLLVGACTLLLLGGIGFGYLRANSPLGLLSGSDRPIAAATVFVPSRAPFTFSLLTQPERLMALQQVVVSPDWRQQARSEIAQVQQNLLAATGLDYARDIQPWVGEEMTYAYTDVDLDQDAANGQQPGYFLAVEIAPDHQQDAQAFLQLFWQQQALSGNVPQSQQISGVRVLSRTGDRTGGLSTATALVGNQFVIFANDVRVIRHSIRASQTTQNLAQNLAYRQAAAALPEQRVGLAYFDTALLGDGLLGDGLLAHGSSTEPSASFVAVGVGVARTGLTADVGVPSRQVSDGQSVTSSDGAIDVRSQTADVVGKLPSESLRYLPGSSELAVVGDSFATLISSLRLSEISADVVPAFLRIGSSSSDTSMADNPWSQVRANYALAQLSSGSNRDWVLAVKRGADSGTTLQALDNVAAADGYSVVPVALGDDEATAWTRFKVGRRRRQASSGLETELLGLHLQQDGYELFASSLSAMSAALGASEDSLLESPRFLQAIAPLEKPNDGYLYLDWSAVFPVIEQVLPAVDSIDRVAHPFTQHIRAIAATRTDTNARFFIQLKETPTP